MGGVRCNGWFKGVMGGVRCNGWCKGVMGGVRVEETSGMRAKEIQRDVWGEI